MRIFHMNHVCGVIIGLLIALATLSETWHVLFSRTVHLGPETVAILTLRLLVGAYFSIFFMRGKLR